MPARKAAGTPGAVRSGRMEIRAARFPEDYPALAGVLNSDNPAWPATAEDLAREDAARDPATPWLVLLALEGEAALGLANALSGGDGRFRVDLRVIPGRQAQGIGSALYGALLPRLADLGARELTCEVWDGYQRAQEFVTRRGFTEAWRRLHLSLDPRGLPPVDPQPEIRTLAECPVEATLREVYALDQEVAADVPFGDPVPPVTFADFRELTLGNPEFLPEACFVALDGAELAGFSYLTRGDDFLFVEMTGVRRPFRGRGLGRRLKLAGIRYAQQHHVPSLRTINDSPNRAMLALNGQLGFRVEGAAVRYRKAIS